jgi:chitin synthase
MSPPYERYGPAASQQSVPTWPDSREMAGTRAAPVLQSEPASAPRLPFFEAAVARARGANVVYPPEIPANSLDQPLPSYAAPADPNHPDLSVGLLQSNTIRLAMDGGHVGQRGLSRSPSPVLDRDYNQGNGTPQFNRWRSQQDDSQDYRSRLLGGEDLDIAHGDYNGRWNEKVSPLGLHGVVDGDLALPPFIGVSALPPSAQFQPSDAEELTPKKEEYTLEEADLAASTTQHFGPAPMGRVGRRTHNAEGGRRIRHTATLDENGFFAVDMPIPTRLAQFLPFKGVEEQKCTR